MGEPPPDTLPTARPAEDRLDSWKEIAAHLNRDVTTVQRWEKREGMPVHRHLHDRMGSVFASRAELDVWMRSRNPNPTTASTVTDIVSEDPRPVADYVENVPAEPARGIGHRVRRDEKARPQSARDLGPVLRTAVVVALAAALFAWWRMPPAVPVIESVTQLTNDGEPKLGTLVSDGARIYFNEGQTRSWKIAQVSVKGGPTTPVATRLVNPRLIALAPDGSSLLAALGGMDAPVGPLWSIPLPAGEPRPLGRIEGQAADFFPDGRFVFSTVTALYVADKDGSNSRKLYSGRGEAYNPTVSPDGRRIAFGTQMPDHGHWPRLLRTERIFVSSSKAQLVLNGVPTGSM